jgi:hypothetical protein
MPPQHPIPAELFGKPFTFARACELGLSPQVLCGKRFRRPFRGVYVSSEVPDILETRVDAVLLLVPETSVISHHTAAQLRGLPVPASEQVHVQSDVAKVELLKAMDPTALVITAEDVEGRPERTLGRILQALLEAGHPKVPRELLPGWRSHLMPPWARGLEPPEDGHPECDH